MSQTAARPARSRKTPPTSPLTEAAPSSRKARGGEVGGTSLHLDDPALDVHIGDCREILPRLKLAGTVDLVFADPPFNWNRAYDKWHDAMPREDYIKFTHEWLDLCIAALRPGGSFWVNIPDDTAAEIVVHLKSRGLEME